MRIELNGGGLSTAKAISAFQDDLDKLAAGVDGAAEGFKTVKNNIYQLGEDTEELKLAMDSLQRRITAEESRSEAAKTIKEKAGGFVDLAESVDRQVAESISSGEFAGSMTGAWTHRATELFFDLDGNGGGGKKSIKDLRKEIFQYYNKPDTEPEPQPDSNKTSEGERVERNRKAVFDVNRSDFEHYAGRYGGNQGFVFNIYFPDDFYKFEKQIIKYHPEMAAYTDEQWAAYFTKFNSEGCGYIAIANSILVEYYDKPEEFERLFGFPMYDENGDLNFDMLAMDIYGKYDNYDPYSGRYDASMDFGQEDGSSAGYDPSMDTSGNGMNLDFQKYYMEMYLQDHGAPIPDISGYGQSLTPADVQRELDAGHQVLIAYFNGDIYQPDGTPAPIQGGHAMYITGVTDDGKYIVSSWGNQYYLDPNKSFPNYGSTRLEFSTVAF